MGDIVSISELVIVVRFYLGPQRYGEISPQRLRQPTKFGDTAADVVEVYLDICGYIYIINWWK